MSVTVGFSQATTPLIVPAPGTTKPDGTPADGSAEAGGEAGLFAALLAMLAPGAQPPAETEATSTVLANATAVAAPSAILPLADQPDVAATPETPPLPDLADLQKTFDGKALLKDFADALKAAKTALDEGKPLDPALEKKLKETVDAIAAWIAGQPQLQPATVPVDTSKLTELAAGSTFLPTAPSGDLPDAPAPVVLPEADVDAPTITAPANPAPQTGTGAETAVQAQPVPARLAELGNVLKDFAAQLEKVSPDLAKALGKLADRISVGDIADDVMAQLGLTRSPDSTSPELDQLVAALTAKPEAKTTAAVPATPIATPVLDIPEVLARQSAAVTVSPEAKTEAKEAEAPQPEAVRPEAKTEKPEPLARIGEVDLDTDVTLDARATRTKDDPAPDARPSTPVAAGQKPDTPAPAAAPAAATGADNPAQVAQAAAATAATATRAIHAAYAAPVQQLNVPQVAFEVVRQFEAGNTRFQIRLDPADLGRIDVKLDLEKNGTINARMFVERPETLDLMMRDQRALQQALQQTGLDMSKTNLEFSLRQNPFAGSGGNMGQGGSSGGQPGFGPFGTPVTDESTELAAQTLYRGSASASGVNLFV